jgi:hypothetical protein
MKPFAFLFFCMAFHTTHSQQDPITGNLASSTRYTIHGMPAGSKLENLKNGSVFFLNDWMNSTIILKNGEQYKNIKAKLNLYKNKVHYLNNDTELVSDSPISDVILMDSVNNTSYHFVNYNRAKKPDAPAEEHWFLSLKEGAASLYKLFEKTIEESRVYSSAIVDRSIRTKESYFILYKGALQPISRIRELPEILFDKQPELYAFIRQNSKKPFEKQLVEAVAYYNTLKQ